MNALGRSNEGKGVGEMRRIRLITMAVTAVLTLGAVLSATAWAAELPEFSVETGFSGTGAKSSIETKGGTKITCEKLTTEGAATSKKSGNIHIELKECKVLGLVKCTGLGEASGVILMLGEWRLVSDGAGHVLMLISAGSGMHVECSVMLLKVTGSFLATITPDATETTKYELGPKESKGKQEFTEYLNDEGKTVSAGLLTSTNGGTFEESAVEMHEARLTTTKTTVIGGAPPLPGLEKIYFTNSEAVLIDHQTEAAGEKAVGIKEVGELNELQWVSSAVAGMTKNWPLMFVKGTIIKLEARFLLIAETREFLLHRLEGNAKIAGEASVDGVSLTFSAELTLAAIKTQLEAHSGYLTTTVVNASSALALKVTYKEMKINWKWEVKETGRANPYIQQLGESKHNLYVINATPRPLAKAFFTLLDAATLGVEKEAQPPEEKDVIKGVWREFEVSGGPAIALRTYKIDTGTISRIGKPLTYYSNVPLGSLLEETEESTCAADSVAMLLEALTGKCEAWAEVFAFALGTEGTQSKTLETYSLIGSSFLVKNWKFAAGGGTSGEMNYPYLSSEITDEEGIPGQGVTNPPAWFENHFIVEALSKALYDPSYGTSYSGANPLKELQTASIAGFCNLAQNCQQATSTLRLTTVLAREF